MSRAELHNFLRNLAQVGSLPPGVEPINTGDHSKPDPTKAARIALSAGSLARIESVTRKDFKAQVVDNPHAGARALDEIGIPYSELWQFLRLRIRDISLAWEKLLKEALKVDVASSATTGSSPCVQSIYSALISTYGSAEGLYDHFLPEIMALETTRMAGLAVTKFPAVLGYNPSNADCGAYA